MTAPGIDAYRFLAACGTGWLLGILYEFLRPLRPRHTLGADLLFVLLSAAGWFWVGFAVCDGDLRPAYLAGLFLGEYLLIRLPGRLLRPAFHRFWHFFAVIFTPLQKIFRRIRVFSKIIVASGKKSVKIEGKNPALREDTSGRWHKWRNSIRRK